LEVVVTKLADVKTRIKQLPLHKKRKREDSGEGFVVEFSKYFYFFGG